MRAAIASILIAGLIVVLGGFAAIYTGMYNVAATEPHWPATSWILETARVRSIKAHATGIKAPPGLQDPAKTQMGVEHFAAHCAVCHGAPPSRDLRPSNTSWRPQSGRATGGEPEVFDRGYKAFHCGNHDPRIAIFILYP